VPVGNMNYFEDMKVCYWCMNQKQDEPPHDKFVYEPHYGQVQCIMCDSYNTIKIESTQPQKYRCRECGEEFI
jgi:hypothetical protein